MVNHTDYGNIAVGHKESIARAKNNALHLLNQLAEAHALLDLLQSEIEAARNEIIPAEIRAELAALDLEYAAKIGHANERIKWLTSETKEAALKAGGTVKGERMHAVFMAGRVKWDTKALDGYLIHEPALAAFRSEGEPSVSLRWAKGK